ncbi:MAG: imidazolonepropionase [Chlamydiota bacterium]|nr:imidazolonepropionase [Chlamydiota bacterium]
MNTIEIFGPFKQIVTMDNLPGYGPLNDEMLDIIYDGGIRVLNGVILEIGPYHQIKQNNDKPIALPNPSIVVPGFVDAHTHMLWAGSRANDYAKRLSGVSYQEIAANGGGILDTVNHTRKASSHELETILLKHAEKHFNRGITTCEVKSGYGLNVADELKMLQVINNVNDKINQTLIPTCLAAHTIPWEFNNPEKYLNHLIEELLPEVKERNLSQRIDIFVEEEAFPCELAQKYLMKSKELGFTTCVHADQFTRGGSSIASQVGSVSADHLEQSTSDDIVNMKKHNVTPIVLPGASLGLGMPFAPARKMLDEGLPLVLASDWNPGSAPQGDLLMQAAILGASEKLTIAETLASITCRPAKVLGYNDRGTIKPGFRADFAIYPTRSFQDIVYFQGSLHPFKVFANGHNFC